MINSDSRIILLVYPLLALPTFFLVSVLLVTPVHAVSIVVTTNNTELDGSQCTDRDYRGGTGVSIAEAICLANNNGTASDTISFAAGIRTTTVTQSIPPVTDTIIINGNGVENTVIQGNAAPDTASWRIFVVDPGGNLTLSGMTLRNGRCDGSCEFANTQNGGAIANRGSLTVDRCVFTGNTSSEFNGGVIANEQGTVTVTNSTFFANKAVGSGGGGAISNNGTLTLSTNTFFANSTENGNGGAILNSGTANLTNNTLSENYSSGGNGGGLYNSGTLDFTNTIIANSSAGGDCYNLGGSTIGTNKNNLIEDSSCTPALNGDPNLGPLTDNGGPTPTMELLQTPSTSPAINTGDDDACPATDQRGETRPNGPACDIGAYEAMYIPNATDFFVTTWKTDNPGASGATSITVPMVGGPYDLDVDNDGIADQFGLNGPTLFDFGVPGTYSIGIHGSFDSIRFDNNSDKLKFLSVDQWGTGRWTSMNSAFHGAANLQVTANDTPDFSAVTDMESMFRGASLADPDTSNWNTSSVTNMNFLFYEAVSASPDTSNWNTSMVESMRGMFFLATSANPDVSAWNTSRVADMVGMFFGATSARPDTSNWDTGAAEDISLMFYNATLANPDVSNWNTAQVANMQGMFYGATSADPNTGDWDVTSVTNASQMFFGITLSTSNYERLLVNWGAQALKTGVAFHAGNSNYCSSAAVAARASMATADSWEITDGGPLCSPGDDFITTWKTDNPGTSGPASIMVPMVGGPYEVDWGDGAGFSQFDLSDSATHTYGTAGIYTIRVRGIYDSIFFNSADDKDKILSIDQWGSNRWQTMNRAFDGAGFLQIRATDIPDFVSVTAMPYMFNDATLVNPDTSDWDVTSLTDAGHMFAGVSLSTGNYERLLINWAAKDLKPGVNFDGGNSNYCSSAAVAARASMEASDGWVITDGGSLCSPTDDFVSTWQTDKPGDSNDTSIEVPIVGGPYEADWGDGAGFSESGLSGPANHTYAAAGTYTIRIRGVYDSIFFNDTGDKEKILSVDQWGTNQWKSMKEAFHGAYNLQVPAIDIPDFSALRDMSAMFYFAISANPDSSNWDTSSVTDMSEMFSSTDTADPDTSNWDTSAVTNMSYMFSDAISANPDTSNWNASAVTNMSYMFSDAVSANPDTSNWNTSAVTNMDSMFAGASSANPDTSGWTTSRVIDMSSMFALATSADPDTNGWDVTSLNDATGMFQGVRLSTDNYDNLLVNWDAQILLPTVTFDGGNSTYCSGSAIAARTNMTSADGWMITDGGQCSSTFTVGGTVTGLAGNGLVLQNNGQDDLTIPGDGDFTFSTPLGDRSNYIVDVLTQPTNRRCTIANGSGTLEGANSTETVVTCRPMEDSIFISGFEE